MCLRFDVFASINVCAARHPPLTRKMALDTSDPEQFSKGPIWPRALDILADPSLDPLFWRATRLGSQSAWWQHVPLAHWIVSATEPRVLVELGTHTGVSYSA